MTQNGREELGSDIGTEQPVPVLRERRVIPNGVINAEADEPAEQQIIVDLLHQLSFGTHRVKRLQQRGAQQPLRCNRLSAGAFVKRLELVLSAASTSFTMVRIVRSGCVTGTRASMST